MIHIFENNRALCTLNGTCHSKTYDKPLERFVGPGERTLFAIVVLCNLIDGLSVWNSLVGLAGHFTAMEIVITAK